MLSCNCEVPQTTQLGLGSHRVIAVISRFPARFWCRYDICKVDKKSSTTFSFSVSPGFLSFLREKFPFFVWEIQKKAAEYLSLPLGFLSFLVKRFLFSPPPWTLAHPAFS